MLLLLLQRAEEIALSRDTLVLDLHALCASITSEDARHSSMEVKV